MNRLSLLLALVITVLAAVGCGGTGNSATTRNSAAKITPGGGHGAKAPPVVHRTVPVLIPPPGAPDKSVTVPVLTYHRVHTMPAVGEPDLIVDPATFAAELAALQQGGYHTIHQWQLFDALYKGYALPSKPVIISVDDGYVDDVRTILPTLERYHMVATFFVITGRMSEPGFLDAGQIRQLDQAGMDVGDHTSHHVDLRQLAPLGASNRRPLAPAMCCSRFSAIPCTSSPIRSERSTTRFCRRSTAQASRWPTPLRAVPPRAPRRP